LLAKMALGRGEAASSFSPAAMPVSNIVALGHDRLVDGHPRAIQRVTIAQRTFGGRSEAFGSGDEADAAMPLAD
jgi:hypothetical protein